MDTKPRRKRVRPPKANILFHEEPVEATHAFSPLSYYYASKWRASKRFTFTISLIAFVCAYALFATFHPSHKESLKAISDFLLSVEIGNVLPETIKSKLETIGNLLTFPYFQNAQGTDQNMHLPGEFMYNEGARAHFPIVIIPGITSTGLELWQGKPCSDGHFRYRLWGSLTMLKFLLMDRTCWKEHMKLSKFGRDPPGIKLRAAQGLEAADYIIPGYWVWGRIIENLAFVGYDNDSLYLASFDWRLGFEDLEERDGYFSKLKCSIELQFKKYQKKSVILAHSMGSVVWLYFMQWVQHNSGASRSDALWIDKYIHAVVNIGPPYLGLPKTLSSLISGEMRDTAQLGKLETLVLESFFSKVERTELFRSWPGLHSMLPKGDERIWGSSGTSADDIKGSGSLLRLSNYDEIKCEVMDYFTMLRVCPKNHRFVVREEYFIGDMRELVQRTLPADLFNDIHRRYSDGARNIEITENPSDFKSWSNPLQHPLPNAPNLTIYSLYGVGNPSERAYYYTHDEVSDKYSIDVSVHSHEHKTSFGIVHADGDGTVPLVSLGLVPYLFWRSGTKWNPHGVTSKIKEYQHEPTRLDIRGGPKTSDHVDILGNAELTLDILKIVTYHSTTKEIAHDDNEMKNSHEIISELPKIARKINKKLQK